MPALPSPRGAETDGSVPDEGPPAQQVHAPRGRRTAAAAAGAAGRRPSVDSVDIDPHSLAGMAWDFLQYSQERRARPDLRDRRAPRPADKLRINQVRKVLTAFFPALSLKEVQFVLDKDGQEDITFAEFARKIKHLEVISVADDWDPLAAFGAIGGSLADDWDPLAAIGALSERSAGAGAQPLDFERFEQVWSELGVHCVDEEVARALMGRILSKDMSSRPVTSDDFKRLCTHAMPMDALGRHSYSSGGGPEDQSENPRMPGRPSTVSNESMPVSNRTSKSSKDTGAGVGRL